jgi:hypothetical protein
LAIVLAAWFKPYSACLASSRPEFNPNTERKKKKKRLGYVVRIQHVTLKFLK